MGSGGRPGPPRRQRYIPGIFARWPAGTWAGEVGASVAARGPVPPDAVRVAAGPVTGRRGPVRRGTAARRLGAADAIGPGVSNGHGQTAAGERHAINTTAEAPHKPSSGCMSSRNTLLACPVRGNADGAHRPSQLCTPSVLTARTPVRYASVDSAI